MNEIKQLRMNIMGGMNAYVLETIEDEDILDYWWTYGLPDEVTEEMLADYAEDDAIWLDVVHAFAKVLRME
jgi:hypothetical protein